MAVSRTTATSMIGLSLAGAVAWSAPLLAESPRNEASAASREIIPLTEGWLFLQGGNTVSAEQPQFDDSKWESVSLPHSWNRVGTYMPQVATRINTPESTNKAMGVGWYRLTYTPADALRGKRIWLEFDAASRVATVWMNGRLLGEHKGGYSRFRIDATDQIRFGHPNLLAVRTDNTRPAIGTSTADVLPLSGDFFVPGGLYRPVRLVATNQVHIDMEDAGGPGVRAVTREVRDGLATVEVDVGYRNSGAHATRVGIRTTLVAANGVPVTSSQELVAVAPGGPARIKQTLTVPKAHVWHGVDDPYLYRLVVELVVPGGAVLDRVEQPFGIRTIAIDAQRGFLLNGRPYTLRGVGYHQDREDKGWAVSEADVEADVKLLREMGASSIRLTHYQHGQPIHDLADRHGLILWDEIPLVSQWTLGDAKVASDGLRANARQQLTELVRQNQNHASVAVWSIANEVDFGNSLPGFLTNHSGSLPNPMPLLSELNGLAKSLDPSRHTTLATCCEGRLFAEGVSVPVTAPAADLGGANRYFGWYYGKPEQLEGNIDLLRSTRPNQPLSITEYGAGGALTIHTDNVLGGSADSRGRAQPEEYESYVHETNWTVLSKRSDLWGTWLWAAFDFASTVRREGDADDINTKGLVAFDHKTRKDAYYFYKANWSANPTIHVTGRRYVERAYQVADVRVYSNAALTHLTVNGMNLPSLSNCPQRICVWSNVALKAGHNEIIAKGDFAKGTYEDRIAWNLSPDVIRAVRIDSGTMVAAKSALGHFGSDNFFTGGTAGTVVKPADYGKPALPVVIAGTPDSEIAATYRQGDFAYRLPIPDGRYMVTLTFIEPSARAGENVFDVIAGKAVKLKRFDVAAAGGSASSVVVRRFPVTVRGGSLDLQFRPREGRAIVSSLQLERSER